MALSFVNRDVGGGDAVETLYKNTKFHLKADKKLDLGDNSDYDSDTDVRGDYFRFVLSSHDDKANDDVSDCSNDKEDKDEQQPRLSSSSQMREYVDLNCHNMKIALDSSRVTTPEEGDGDNISNSEMHASKTKLGTASICGEEFFGRADILRPILTLEERKMLGISSIPAYFLENHEMTTIDLDDNDNAHEEALNTDFSTECSSSSNDSHAKLQLRPDLVGVDDGYYAEDDRICPPTHLKGLEYFVGFHGIDEAPSITPALLSALRNQRDDLLQTIRRQKKVDLDCGLDKMITERLINFRIGQVKREYTELKGKITLLSGIRSTRN